MRERRKRGTRKSGLGGAQARGALERRERSPLPGAAGPQGWRRQGRGSRLPAPRRRDQLRSKRSEKEEPGRPLAFSLRTAVPMAGKGSHGGPVCIFVGSRGAFICCMRCCGDRGYKSRWPPTVTPCRRDAPQGRLQMGRTVLWEGLRDPLLSWDLDDRSHHDTRDMGF